MCEDFELLVECRNRDVGFNMVVKEYLLSELFRTVNAINLINRQYGNC